jgi:UDP-N-acetylglucosamine:LPS N-acetylglucosamine transferase
VELLRLRPAFGEVDVTFVTTDPDLGSMIGDAPFRVVTAATRQNKLRMLLLIVQLLWILFRDRPTAIVTTGAAPGYIAIRLGKLFGIKTLWIDSIANADELSLSGQLASRQADKTLTQWPHLTRPGVEYHGAII